MRIAITGASGLIGRALTDRLEPAGHQVTAITRGSRPGAITWDPAHGRLDADALDGVDAVVNLAGAGVASGPWTAQRRRLIHDSRTDGTGLLARTLAGLDRPPSVLVSASAIGYYGNRGDEVLTEDSAPGDDFLGRLCQDWEAAAAPAADAGIRTVRIRTGIVLSRDGGALKAQLPAFRLGLGGQAGDGRQWMSWIGIDDEVGAIVHALEHDDVSGPVNATAPEPVTNAAFTDAVGRAVHRPTFLRIPRLVSHLPVGVGPLLENLLFVSQRVEPTVLTATGYRFAHPTLDEALAAVLDG